MNYKLVKIINTDECIRLSIAFKTTNFPFMELKIKYNIMKDTLYIMDPYTETNERIFREILNDIGLTKPDITFYKNKYDEKLYIAIINHDILKNLISLWNLKGIEITDSYWG